jgi:type VI secretion system protein ImpL
VAFAERGLGRGEPQVERRRRWIARGVLAATGGAGLVVSGLWWVSYRANQAYIAQVDQKVAPGPDRAEPQPGSAMCWRCCRCSMR